jgi:REP element-mobilizing transposase RayT
MKRARQLGFEILEGKNVSHFGGTHLKNSNAKEKRPISTKRSMHLVMRSSYAKGNNSLLKRERKIREIIDTQGKAFGVKVYRQANGGNHLHLIVLPRSRNAFIGFIRAISGLITRAVLNTEKGRSLGFRFWDRRPFTRIVEWGREFKVVSTHSSESLKEESDALLALMSLGYGEREAREALKDVSKDGVNTSNIVREALKILSK